MSDALLQLERVAARLCSELRASPDEEQARRRFEAWLDERRRALRAGDADMHPLDHARARECVEILDGLTAPRNEARMGESALLWLWRLLRGEGEARERVSPGFVWEFVHLFTGAAGRAKVARGWLGPALAERGASSGSLSLLEGHEAGRARSGFLDVMGELMWGRISAFACGLDPEMVERRRAARARILDALGGDEHDWFDHHWQLAHAFNGPGTLERLTAIASLSDIEAEAIRLAIEHEVPFGITPHYLSLFDLDDSSGRLDAQVRAQVIPPMHYVRRMIEHRCDRRSYFDFMGEADTSPLELVTRRYPAVAILKALDTCPQICVYCQRNWEIEGPMQPAGFPAPRTIEQALDWFAAHESVRDILVTGGDPLFHDTARIVAIMERIATMDHVMHVRWGTRAPVTMPMRITEALAEQLGRFVEPGRRTVSVVTHVESPLEVTPEMTSAVHRLRTRAIPVYNQQVYTVFTSRRFQTAALRVALKNVGIDPYYTFYPKGKEETRAYIVPLARVLQERKEEARLLPGIFRTDEPVFNVPRLGKNHIRAGQDRELIGIRPSGRRVYLWHPWEKGVATTEPWQYEDTSIHVYLGQLEALGEDPEDYASIWYYY